jgi:ribosomal protein S18 acetylase RimI-like enzyme
MLKRSTDRLSSIYIREMEVEDLAFASECTAGEGWVSENFQTLAGFLLNHPSGCLLAEENGYPVGICIATPYGKSGFIGELIVRPEVRGRGVGASLLNRGLDTLREGGAETVYLDGVLKLNRFRNESKVAMSDGTKAKGNYESSAVGGSLEFGRHINFADGYFLEPYAQLSSVWVQGDSYTLDNGMQANNERTQSTLGKVGTSAGRSIALKDGGVLTPYVRVAMAQEFSGSNDVKVNDKRFGNDLSGSRAELGAGVSVSLSERLQLHADFDYMKGKNVEQPWGANVGLKLAF